MKTEKELRERLNEIEMESATWELAKATRIKEIAPEVKKKISNFEKKIEELKPQLPKKQRKCTLLGVMLGIVFLIIATVNFFYLKVEFLTVVSIALGIICAAGLVSIEAIKNKKSIAPIQNQIDSLRLDIYFAEDTLEYGTNDEFCEEVKEKLSKLKDEKTTIKNQLDEIIKKEKIRSVLGNNTLLVYANTEASLNLNSSKTSASVSFKIDGVDRGTVAYPFSIINLDEGIHSISFEMYCNATGNSLTTKTQQFSVKENNTFFVLGDIHFASVLECCRCNIEKYDDFDTFVAKSKLNKVEIEKYLVSL